MSVDFGINYNLNSDVDISSWQESNLDVYKLDEIVEQSKAANTKKCTSWGITKLRKWAMKRNISINFKDVSPDSLNDILRKFYAEVKTEKKQMLSPSALINWYPCCNIYIGPWFHHRTHEIWTLSVMVSLLLPIKCLQQNALCDKLLWIQWAIAVVRR